MLQYWLSMAKLSQEDVLKLAKLANLELSPAEIEEFKLELSEILDYVDILQKVDVNDLQPTHQVNGLINVMRKDEVKNYGYNAKDLLKNVPKTENNQIMVNRIIN